MMMQAKYLWVAELHMTFLWFSFWVSVLPKIWKLLLGLSLRAYQVDERERMYFRQRESLMFVCCQKRRGMRQAAWMVWFGGPGRQVWVEGEQPEPARKGGSIRTPSRGIWEPLKVVHQHIALHRKMLPVIINSSPEDNCYPEEITDLKVLFWNFKWIFLYKWAWKQIWTQWTQLKLAVLIDYLYFFSPSFFNWWASRTHFTIKLCAQLRKVKLLHAPQCSLPVLQKQACPPPVLLLDKITTQSRVRISSLPFHVMSNKLKC